MQKKKILRQKWCFVYKNFEDTSNKSVLFFPIFVHFFKRVKKKKKGMHILTEKNVCDVREKIAKSVESDNTCSVTKMSISSIEKRKINVSYAPGLE